MARGRSLVCVATVWTATRVRTTVLARCRSNTCWPEQEDEMHNALVGRLATEGNRCGTGSTYWSLPPVPNRPLCTTSKKGAPQ